VKIARYWSRVIVNPKLNLKDYTANALTDKVAGHPTDPFTIGVGGVVIENKKTLLVKLTYGHKGWVLPGGYVKSTETIGQAIKREVYEETRLEVQPTELVAVRSRIIESRSDIYVAFLVKVLGGELQPDHAEISDVRYFSLAEMEERDDVPKLNTWIARRALQSGAPRFSLSDYNRNAQQLYELWF